MNAKVDDVMNEGAIVIPPELTVGQARKRMLEEHIHALPVVQDDGEPIGMLTSSDLVSEHDPGSAVAEIMTDGVFTVPRYADVHVAARVMRNHRLHHVVVTHEKRVVGILSSFDLLRLVEDHRFVMKNAPTSSSRRAARRQ